MKQFVVALFLGLLFGLGLAMGGMTNPQKVLAFLDVAGEWDPSLILLMVSAVLVTYLIYQVSRRQEMPLLGGEFSWPKMKRIDMPVVVGPMIFGVGWGMGGVCPGPGLALITTNSSAALWFVPAMFLGFWFGRPHHRRARRMAHAEELEATSNGRAS